jgi:WD40 repeat protein
VGLIGLTAWTAASSALGLNPNAAAPSKAPPQSSVTRHDDQGAHVAKDAYGDPLPAGALARLGTVSLRHGEAIQAIAFSPDGKTIACTDGGKFISLWDRSTGKEVRRIPGASAMALAFSPDGRLLAMAGGKYVELFDAATGERLHQLGNQTFTQKGDSTFSMGNVPLVFSADGRMVASANSDRVAMVWDTVTGKELMRTAPMKNSSSLRFLPDGKTLLSLSGARQADGAIQLWAIATGKEISKVVIPHQKSMGSQPLAIAPDGKTVAIQVLVEMREKRGNSTIVYWPQSIRLLDTTNGQLRLHVQGKSSVIYNVVFSPDSRCLAWTNMDGEVTIWDTQADKPVHKFRQAGGGDGGSSAIAYDREGKTLAASSQGTALQIWDLVSGKELLNKEAHGSSIRAVVYSPNGRTVASASADQTIRVWDAGTGKALARLTGHAGPADAIAYSPDGRHFATAASDGSVRLWDRSTGREIHQFNLPNIDTGNGGARVVSRSVAFTPDSQTLIAAGSDLKFYKWDVSTGKELEQRSWSLDGVEQPGNGTERFVNPSHVRFSPDGRTAAATGGKAIHLVDVASGREFAKFAGEAGPETLAFSADSRTLVTGGWGKVLRVWEAASAKIIREIKVDDFINAVAASPDGRIVAAGCGWNPASIHLYDVVTGKEVLTFSGLASYIGDLNFATDGMTLVSGQRDSTGLIWDVAGAYRQAKGAPTELAENDLEKLWTDLESEDAARANAAARTLSSSPKSAPHLLKDRLPPAPMVTVERLMQLIADLDADVFAKRQAASRELSSFGTDAHAELRKTLQGKVSLEHRRRILALLDGPTRFMPNVAQLQRIRAIGVLERIGNDESVAILRNLALGAPAAPETQETKAALERLSRR